MTQLEHIEAIEKRLWGAADNLRANSNYAGNEYFLPVMGRMFLRHDHSRYLRGKAAIKPNLPSRGGKTRPLTKEDFSGRSAKPKKHLNKVLMIDARNIYCVVTRKIYDFSPEQQQNLLAIG